MTKRIKRTYEIWGSFEVYGKMVIEAHSLNDAIEEAHALPVSRVTDIDWDAISESPLLDFDECKEIETKNLK